MKPDALLFFVFLILSCQNQIYRARMRGNSFTDARIVKAGATQTIGFINLTNPNQTTAET